MSHAPPRRVLAGAAAIAAAALAIVAGAAAPAVAGAPTWTRLRFQLESARGHGHGVRLTTDVFPDGRVVFDGDRAGVSAPTVARAPADLLAAVTAWAARGPAAGPAHPHADYVVQVSLQGKHPRAATYPADALPSAEKDLYDRASALTNSPQTPVPCPTWDGKGAFTLTFVSQDFGVAPGPIARVTYASTGRATRTTAYGVDATPKVVASTKATAAELRAIRAALVKVDLGHFTDVYGGAGEGSNLRLVHLRTRTGTCGRAFTNQLPDGLRPLIDTLAPVAARMSK